MARRADWIQLAGQAYDASRLEKDRLVEESDPARKVFIVSFPKCGRTWLRVMLSRYKQLTLGASEFRLKLHMLCAAEPRFSPQIMFYHAGSNYPWGRRDHRRFRLRRFFDRRFDLARMFTMERCAGSKIVFLVRDPRDTIVSYYHHRARQIPHHKYQGGFAAFLRDPDLGIAHLLKFMNWLAAERRRHEHVLMFYEELRADPRREFERLLRFAGMPIEETALADALEFGGFENMKRMELERRHGSELSARDPNDPNAFKVRKGKVGGHREEMSAADADYLEAAIRANLDPLFSRYLAPAPPAAAEAGR